MLKSVLVFYLITAVSYAQDRCLTDEHPTLKVKGSCMEISDCEARGGIYEHNWCMTKAASIKCCFKKQEEVTEAPSLSLDFDARCGWEGQLLPHLVPTKFYKCSHGTKYALDCPFGQIWYQMKQWCDYPGMDYGWADLFSSLVSIDYFDYLPTKEDNEDDSEWDDILTEIDDNLAAVQNSRDRCDNEAHPEYGKGSCVEKAQCQGVYVDNWCQSKAASVKCCFNDKKWDSICQNGGLHAHQDPAKFIKCISGKAVTLDCPLGQVWISEAKKCDSPPAQGNLRRISVSFLRHPNVEGIRNDAYCLPPADFPKSGVTIGIGVDFGSKNAQSLRDAGVSESIIQKVTPYFGKTGTDACKAARETHPLVLSERETMELSDAIIKQESEEVARKYNTARASGSKTFDDLTCAQRTVIASVLYQYGGPSRVPKFWTAVTANNWPQVINELRTFGDKHTTRRNLEADFLENDGNVKNCPAPSVDTCEITKGTCVQRASCGGKVISNFCQHQATTVVCCLSGASASTAQPTAAPSNRVAAVREAIADEAWSAAGATSLGKCARYVREAIERGYQKATGRSMPMQRTESAKDYGPSLIKYGFKLTTDTPQKGDVVIFQAVQTRHPHGHIAIYTGTNWVSDFRQKSINVAQAYIGQTPTFYRYFGN